jgi:Fe2+ or Zn2+ uptake regulation protein
MVSGTMQPTSRLHTELWHYRLSRTRQRDRVYFEVGRFGPITPSRVARELAGIVGERTVYRTIHTFISAQIFRELPGGLIELAPPFRRQRYYIICRSCSRRTPFYDEALDTKLNSILQRKRFVLPAHQVELSGLCELCAETV